MTQDDIQFITKWSLLDHHGQKLHCPSDCHLQMAAQQIRLKFWIGRKKSYFLFLIQILKIWNEGVLNNLLTNNNLIIKPLSERKAKNIKEAKSHFGIFFI